MAAPIIGYELRYRPAGTNQAWKVQNYGPSSTTLSLSGLARGTNYEGEARSIGPNGLASVWVPVTFTVAGASLVPLAPTGFAATTVADGVALKWVVADQQRTDVEYRIDRAPDSGGAPGTWAELTRVRALQYTDPVTDQLRRWYRVRAVSFAGIESAVSTAVDSFGKAANLIESETAPSNPSVGTLWYQPSTRLTRYWNGVGWSLQADNSLETQAVSTLVKNGGFEAGAVYWTNLGTAPSVGNPFSISAGAAYIGTFGMALDLTLTSGGAYKESLSDPFAINPADTFVGECIARPTGSPNGTVSLSIWFYKADGSASSILAGRNLCLLVDRKLVSGSTWGKAAGGFKPPADAAYARIGIGTVSSTTGGWQIDQFRVVRMDPLRPAQNLLPNANFGGPNGYLFPWRAGWNPGGLLASSIHNRLVGGNWGGPSWFVQGNSGVLSFYTGARTAAATPLIDIQPGDDLNSMISVIPGQRYQFHMKMANHRCVSQLIIVWADANGNGIGLEDGVSSVIKGNGGGLESNWETVGFFAVAPAAARTCRPLIRRWDTDAGQSDSYSWYMKAFFGEATDQQVDFTTWLDGPVFNADQIGSGVGGAGGTFGVVNVADVWDYSVSRRIGLRVAGSNQRLADQRNLMQSLTTSYGSVRNTGALSANSSGQVSVLAHSVRYGGVSIPYNAVTNAIVGVAPGTKIVVYCSDPDYTGGTKTWFAGTSPDQVMQLGDGIIIAGEITIPTSGTSTGGGGSGGGTEWCVASDMLLPGGLAAVDVAIGDRIKCWDYNGREPGVILKEVTDAPLAPGVACTEIETACGAVVVASDCTPMTLRTGDTILITQMLGQLALVLDADGHLSWSEVIRVESIGPRTVVKIKVDQHCYFAGRAAARTIATHNPVHKP